MERNLFFGFLLFLLSPWLFPFLVSFLPETAHYSEYTAMVGLCLGSIAGGILGGQILNQRAKKVFIVNIIFYTIILPISIALGILFTIRISDLLNIIKYSFLNLTIIAIRIELMMILILMVQYISISLTRNPSMSNG